MKHLVPVVGSAWTALLLALAAAGACGEAEPARLVPTVEMVDGVEVATLGPIPGPFDPDWEWTFRVVREVPTVPGDEDEPLVFDPAAVLPLSTGKLLVHDPTADRPLVILDPETVTALARFGSKGRGPGELGQRLELLEGEAGMLVVLDLGNRQVHRFTSDGVQLPSSRLDLDRLAAGVDLAPDASGFVLEVVNDVDRNWLRGLVYVGAEVEAARQFLELPQPSGSSAGVFQRGRVLWTVMSGGVVTMWANEPVVHVHTPDGRRIREVRLPLTRREMDSDEIERRIARDGDIARGLRPGPMGLTNVLYSVNDTIFGMMLTDMWRAAEDPPIPETVAGRILWRMFSVRGEYVGVARQPLEMRYLGRGDGTFWARVLDERAYPVIQELTLERRGDA